MSLPFEIELLILLIVCSAFFSCSETAFFSLTRAELHKIKHSRHSYAKYVVRLLQHSRELLITILLGNELVNIAFTIVVAAIVYDVVGDISWKASTIISVCIAAPVIIIFGEVIPKNVAVRNAKALIRILVFPIRLFWLIAWPIRVVLTRLADFIVRLFGGDPTQVRSMIMEEEFRQLVDLGYKEGALEEGESELIHRLFELENKRVKEIMTPSGKIFSVSLAKPLDEIVQEVRATQFNRIPVYQENRDDIVGVIHARDLVRLIREAKRGHSQEMEALIRPAHFVAEDMIIEDVLTDLQKLKTHVAIVLNKKKKVVGLVTMDDIFQLLFTHKIERPKSKVRSLESESGTK